MRRYYGKFLTPIIWGHRIKRSIPLGVGSCREEECKWLKGGLGRVLAKRGLPKI